MKHLKTIPAFLLAFSAYLLPVSALSANIVENTIVSQDSSGNATGIWDLIDTTTNIRSIQVSTQDAGTDTWSTATTISNTDLDSYSPIISVNASGDAVAAWLVIDPEFGIVSIAGSIFTNATGTWSTPEILSTSNENINATYSVKLNDNGNICAVWSSILISSDLTVARGVLGTVSGGWGTSSDMSPEQ